MYLETTLDLERRRDNHDNDLAACCKTQPEIACKPPATTKPIPLTHRGAIQLPITIVHPM